MADTVLNSALRVVVVTPEDTAVDTSADFASMPLFDGELGVGKGHAPMIGRLGFGELRIRSDEEVTRFFVDGGFVQVADNVVSVMTGRAVPVDKVDKPAAEEALSEALAIAAAGEEAIAYRDREVSRARGLLRVASRAPA